MVFGESNLHVKKILGGSAQIFPILANSSDLSHKRTWKILGMVWVKSLKKRLGVRVVLRFDFEGHRPLFRSSVSSIGSPSMVASTDLVGSGRSPSPYTYIQRKVRSIWVPNPTTDEHSAGPDSLVLHTTAIGHFH